jgi:hypothetical protein
MDVAPAPLAHAALPNAEALVAVAHAPEPKALAPLAVAQL